MPVRCEHPLKCLSQEEFGDIAYEVMKHIFAVHRELGRFFDERVYHHELAHRLPNAAREVAVELSFRDFCTTLFLDLVVESSAIFELKAVESLAPRHRAQLLNYLLLTNSFHGKLVNLRPEYVHHEFVNSTLTWDDRKKFTVQDEHWKPVGPANLKDWLVDLLRDWGVGLELSLYDSAVKHFYSSGESFEKPSIVAVDGRLLGVQDVRQVAPGVAIRFSAIANDKLDSFLDHLTRFFNHTSLRALHWINMSRQTVQFTTIA